ncbi:beta family protein [Microvirga thermotolerans]|uniref:Beta protein n=1 Tax=Microvirga thermotolerans TaxID=2651334 RepID=A0A5P9JUK9_9HYPH|nr:hypothetical protein [Microvirga thermotolerans]QFU15316.1 hypothetical protein GDR74_03240 [Microvirga thermotolerans]
MTISFDDYTYYPSLRTRLWEMRGYKELGAAEKERVLPMFVLTKHNQTTGAGAVCQVVQASLEERSFILDVESSPIYACDDTNAFLDPAGGFQAWRNFVQAQPGAIPTALLPSGAPIRDIVRQVIEFERVNEKVVVRSRSPAADLSTLIAIISAVDSVENLLIVLDFGYVRSRVPACAVDAANTINALRNVDPTVRVVVMGSSYPRSAAAYDDAGAALEIEERILHAAIGGNTVAIYGDHSSIHPEPFEPLPSRFVPRIDYALADSWIFRRVREDKGGFKECAEQITGLTDWDPRLVDQQVWGAVKIQAAADGDITRMGTPGAWIAVRVNLHLWQQIHFAGEALDEDNGDVFG